MTYFFSAIISPKNKPEAVCARVDGTLRMHCSSNPYTECKAEIRRLIAEDDPSLDAEESVIQLVALNRI